MQRRRAQFALLKTPSCRSQGCLRDLPFQRKPQSTSRNQSQTPSTQQCASIWIVALTPVPTLPRASRSKRSLLRPVRHLVCNQVPQCFVHPQLLVCESNAAMTKLSISFMHSCHAAQAQTFSGQQFERFTQVLRLRLVQSQYKQLEVRVCAHVGSSGVNPNML